MRVCACVCAHALQRPHGCPPPPPRARPQVFKVFMLGRVTLKSFKTLPGLATSAVPAPPARSNSSEPGAGACVRALKGVRACVRWHVCVRAHAHARARARACCLWSPHTPPLPSLTLARPAPPAQPPPLRRPPPAACPCRPTPPSWAPTCTAWRRRACWRGRPHTLRASLGSARTGVCARARGVVTTTAACACPATCPPPCCPPHHPATPAPAAALPPGWSTSTPTSATASCSSRCWPATGPRTL